MDIRNNMNYKQAKSSGLFEYYDDILNTYSIPMYVFNNDMVIREKVLSLLANGHVFNSDGSIDYNCRLVMEVVNHSDENGVIDMTRYDVIIQCYSI